MNKKRQLLALIFLPTLLLSACGTAEIEEPEVVLEKMITTPTFIYESHGDLDFYLKFKEEYDLEAEMDLELDFVSRNNLKDSENIQSENSFDFNGDMSFVDQFAPEIKIDPNIEMSMDMDAMGEDIYLELTTFNLEVDGVSEIDSDMEAKGFIEEQILGIEFFTDAYKNQAIRLKMEELMEIVHIMSDETFTLAHPETLYNNESLLQKIADAEIFLVAQEHGVEEIETHSGGMVDTYHYTIKLNSENFEFIFEEIQKALRPDMEDEIEAAFEIYEEDEFSFKEMLEAADELLDIQVWIGQKDYHLYKIELSSTQEQLENTLRQINQIDDWVVSDGEVELSEAAEFEFTAVIEREPIKSFKLEAPEEFLDFSALYQAITELGF